jgi:hypothetical protein
VNNNTEDNEYLDFEEVTNRDIFKINRHIRDGKIVMYRGKDFMTMEALEENGDLYVVSIIHDSNNFADTSIQEGIIPKNKISKYLSAMSEFGETEFPVSLIDDIYENIEDHVSDYLDFVQVIFAFNEEDGGGENDL